MKTCFRCKNEKPNDSFGRRTNARDGLQSNCKECMSTYHREYSKARPELVTGRMERKAASSQVARQWIWAYKLEHPCVDCGEADPIVLQFDHVRGDKKYNVSQMDLSGLSVALIETEVAKCEIRCANCHVRVTASRGGWWNGDNQILE